MQRMPAAWKSCCGACSRIYYTGEQYDESWTYLQKVQSLLADTENYRLPDLADALIRAESLNYMALISMAKEKGDDAEFYIKEACKTAFGIPDEAKTGPLYNTELTSCALMAQYYLIIRNKKAALEYAEKGLAQGAGARPPDDPWGANNLAIRPVLRYNV